MSRALTEEEVVEKLMRHFFAMAKYWVTLDRPGMSTQERCEGVVFSVLVALDGGSLGLPSFDLVARPHVDDKAFIKVRR
jgi:hypothetical protein